MTPLGSPIVSDAPSPPTDDELLTAYAAVLADGIERSLPGWVVRCVTQVADAWQPGLGRTLGDQAARAGVAAQAAVGPEVRTLLARDVDAQATGPLAIVRTAVRYPTEVLLEAGVGPVVRDEFAERAFPDDRYGLSPASFADLDPSLHEAGLVWGAAKAHVVITRRRAEGRT